MAFSTFEDNVILKLEHGEDKVLESGFVLLANSQPIPNQGKVVAVGEGRYYGNGTCIPTGIEVGMTVVFMHSMAKGLIIEDVEYVIMPATAVLAIVEE